MTRVYVYSQNELKIKQIEVLCNLLNIQISLLNDLDLNKRIKDIIESPVNKNIKEINDEELILFEDFTDGQIEMFLSLYNQKGIDPVSLKAVVTVNNSEWFLNKLLSELKKEREYYQNK